MKTINHFFALASLMFLPMTISAQGWHIERRHNVQSPASPVYYDENEPLDPEFSQPSYNNFANDISFSIGYINKDWVTDTDRGQYHENIWGEEGKRLHGLQVGLAYEPLMKVAPVFGFGFRAGLYYELCYSVSDYVKKLGFDDFTESSLYIPLHAKLRFNITPDLAIEGYAGIGMNWAFSGSFNDRYEYYDRYDGWRTDSESMYVRYGRGDLPHRLNFQYEFGGGIVFKNFHARFTMSKGMTDHRLYQGVKTVQNKIGITVGWSFDSLAEL